MNNENKPIVIAPISFGGSTEPRDLRERFADVVNVKDFGAKGDGIANDTDALNNAIIAATGKTLYIPAGTYITTTGLRIPSHTKVVGAGINQTTIKLGEPAEYFVDCITNDQNWWNYPAAVAEYGPFTQAMQEANQGNEYIVLEDLTADGNCYRAHTGTGTGAHTGSAVHFANVHHLRMRNVRGINGWLHSIDISSAMYTSCYNESEFTTIDGNLYGPWYVGYSDDVILENCEGIDPRNDDCITTHYSKNIKLYNPYAYRNLTPSQVRELGANNHGIEIDDGSFNVYIYGGYAENCNEGLQVKGHGTAYPAHDVFVDGLTVKNCLNNYYLTCGGTVDYTKGRNVSLLNCISYQTASNYNDPTYIGNPDDAEAVNGKHFYGCEYDNIHVQNFRCIGDGIHTRSPSFHLSRLCRNVIVENLSFKDIPMTVNEDDPTTFGSLVYMNSTIASGVQFHNIHADNCPGGYVFRTTVSSHGIVVDGITAHRTVDNGSPVVFVSQGTARHPETIIKNIVATGYAKTYSEGTTSDFSFSQSSNREYAIIGEAETLWKRAISTGSIPPENSYAFNVGWYAETQDVQQNERILIGFKNKVRGNEEKIIGYIGSNHDSEGDETGYYGLIFGCSDAGYNLKDFWEIRYDGRLIPCTDNQNIGYYEGKRPLNIYAHYIYTDNWNIGDDGVLAPRTQDKDIGHRNGNRPLNVYAHNISTDGGTIGTLSDETRKCNIVQIPDDVLDAWEDVEWVQFQFNDAVEKKGEESARLHAGAIAQRIKSVFEAHNIDPFAYGLLCYDSWTAEESPTGEAGSMYTLRYEECLVVEAAYQRRKVRLLEEDVKTMKNSIDSLIQRISVLEGN